MIKRFLRLFRAYRALEKDLERETALTRSLERYIDTLEGRDQERVSRIGELESRLAERDKAIRELKAHLSGLLPGNRSALNGDV